jgi:hypothetical protein
MAERSPNGQFAKGNKGGPKRPHWRTEREYQATIRDTVTPEDGREIVKKTMAQAEEQDARAQQSLTKYMIGEQPA